MEKKEINLYWMYPDMLNLHGDRGNILAFIRIASLLGIELKVKKIENYIERVNWEQADILFFNPGELKTVKKVTEELGKSIEGLKQYVEQGKYIIAIGTSGAIFANEIVTMEQEVTKGLKILNIDCQERNKIIGDDLYFSLEDGQEIIGSQIQMLDINNKDNPVTGKVIYGYGNAGGVEEGARKKNVVFTNALGPVFIKNPWWAEKILLDIAKRKQIETKEIPVEEYEIEVKSFNSAKQFITNKMTK